MQYFHQYHVLNNIFSSGWVLNVAPPPTDPNAYVEDQAVRFHRPFQAKTQEIEASNEQKFQESRRPHATGQVHHMFSRILKLRIYEIFFVLFFYKAVVFY